MAGVSVLAPGRANLAIPSNLPPSKATVPVANGEERANHKAAVRRPQHEISARNYGIRTFASGLLLT